MKNIVKGALIVFGAATSLAISAPALAGCGDAASFKQTALQGQNNSLFKQVSATAPVVGLWSFQQFVGTTQTDFGFQQWHSDGTEIMNSGSRPPATENFCLGVWVQEGPAKFKLNHFALSYDATGALNAVVNIKEEVVVSGNSYSGPFSIDIYDPKSKALLQHLAGKTVAKRVTVDSAP